MKAYAFGVDIGGTAIKLGLFDLGGRLCDKRELPTPKDDGGAHILPAVAATVTGVMKAAGIAPAAVAGIGMGVPGPVGAQNVVDHCVNLGWGVVDLGAEMRRLLPDIETVCAGNDANLAALGELWQGAGRGCSSAVMLTLGTGIGGGVVIGGKILPGAHGGAGEVGHLAVEIHEAVPCSCGKRGCLEQYASASGIVNLAKNMLAGSAAPSRLRQMPAFTAREICALARDGDGLARAIVSRCGRYLGLGLSYLSCAVDPEIFILGGGMSRAGDILLDPVRQSFRENAFHVSVSTPIVCAKLSNDAGIYGGARLVLGP